MTSRNSSGFESRMVIEDEGERIVITRHDRPSAALVSIADLEKIEAA